MRWSTKALRRGASHALLDVLGLAQERDHGVEVGIVARRARERGGLPPVGKVERLPQRPDHAPGCRLPLGHRVPRGRDRCRRALCRPGFRSANTRETRGVTHGLGEEVARRSQPAGLAILAHQCAAQAA
ncbi:hypothetical protein [Demequina litorisediminis]|uniref:Uncharacterized protein n=1 Tax=Demequina litorisediminis TaxID=1849022 RepID=A0ABQ6IG97_9MICO|nr:hypothetical protein [Demequina litorisediminis]GMA36456.1 hypothetical protein GCM10025876_26600 [Demequina litorisediminis]